MRPVDAGDHWLRSVLVAMGSMGVTAGFSRFSFAIALPQMTEDLFHSYTTAGAMVALNFGTYFVVIALIRRNASHVDPSALEKCGVGLTAVGLAVVALAPTTPVAAAGTVILGIAAGGGYVPGTSIIVAVAPPQRRGVAMGIGLAGVGLSIVFTGQVLALFERWGVEPAWRAVFGVQAALGAVILLFAVVYLPTLKPAARTPRATGALRRLPGGPALLATYGLFGLAISIYTGYLVAATRDDRGFSPAHSLLLSSLMGGAMAFALVVGRLSDAIGRRWTVVIGTSVIALGCLSVPWAGEPWLALSAAVAGAFINGTGAAVGAYLGDHLTTAEVTESMSVLTLVMALAQVVAPPVGGWLADATGSFTATFLLAVALAVAAALACARLPDDQRGRRSRAGRGLRAPLAE